MANSGDSSAPQDIRNIRRLLKSAFNTSDRNDRRQRRLGDATFGVYALYDFDGTPLYVGQTCESLRTRLGRHLTNQRSDITKAVVDPWSVAFIEMCPLWKYQGLKKTTDPKQFKEAKEHLNRAEWTLYEELSGQFQGVHILNESPITKLASVQIERGNQFRIIPDDVCEERCAPDRRLARSLDRLATLAGMIRERAVDQKTRRVFPVLADRAAKLALSLETHQACDTSSLLRLLPVPATPEHPDILLAARTKRLSSLVNLLVGHKIDNDTKTAIVEEIGSIAHDADDRFIALRGDGSSPSLSERNGD